MTTPSGPQSAARTLWHHQGDGILAIGVHAPLPGHGEDAEPMLVHHTLSSQGIIGVFDGSGGSGAAPAYQSCDGAWRSGAWVGARVARATVEEWFRTRVQRDAPYDVQSLRQQCRSSLASRPRRRPSKIVGTMRRELPTTMAAVRYELREPRLGCQVLWAGDSRAYLLAHETGLHALSRDHTVETDALEQLLQDPPMTNVICADRDFEIESRTLMLTLPAVLVVATDGFFGYVDTPAQFECNLLTALAQADDAVDWARRLATAVQQYSGDDATLVAVALGYPGFVELRSRFLRRTQDITRWYDQTPAAAESDAATRRRWQFETWERYRPGYELWLEPAGEERR